MSGQIRVLILGLGPRANLSPEEQASNQAAGQQVQQGIATGKELGFHLTTVLAVGGDDDATIAKLEEQIKHTKFDGVLIGGGVRMITGYTVLFERIMNVCFQTLDRKAKLLFVDGPASIPQTLLRSFPSSQST
jgi:hypothetical protein